MGDCDKACIEEVNKMKKKTAALEKGLEVIAKSYVGQEDQKDAQEAAKVGQDLDQNKQGDDAEGDAQESGQDAAKSADQND